MIEASQCVLCEGPIHRLKRALVAPFLATRIRGTAPFCVDLVECRSCAFFFYNPRLSDKDLQRLYTDYRSPEYQEMRQASEPWYTPRFNEDLASAESYQVRRTNLAALLRNHIDLDSVGSILDYGGDRGDLVAGLVPNAKAFVYEISGVDAAPGVTSIANPAECSADLIINSNVLEHVGSPRALVANILRACPTDGKVFLEVPLESPANKSRFFRRMAQIVWMSFAHPSLIRHILRPAALYMMHEHINYFSESSLNALMRAAGGTVIASGTYASRGPAASADLAWCLGSRVAAPSQV